MTEPSPRRSDYPIDPVFLERWSPRAFTGAPMSEVELLGLIEAARWAPSASNVQPWRFLYARRDTAPWDRFLGLLNPSNQAWAKTASALLFVVSMQTRIPQGSDKAVPSRSASFDAGAAWMSVALQARHAGWDAHGMIGFDAERAIDELAVPEGCRVEAAVAIGRRADPSVLPEPLRARERPNDRLPLSAIVMEGGFRT
ncbi:MAG TPA: nitroreductase family protein [Lichenihabitans sp.]|jgi:nitroreductase|nr:nitroreductase family protein [Lichenihabitans sp.]